MAQTSGQPHRQCSHCKVAEGEGVKLQRCSRCQDTYYCSIDHQKAAWKSHKTVCFPPKTEAMLMVHSINPWEVHPVVLDRDHDIWTHGMVSPISMLFGTPLLVLRKIHPDDEETLTSKDREEWDNQTQRQAGLRQNGSRTLVQYVACIQRRGSQVRVLTMPWKKCIIARKDRKPFRLEMLGAVHDYLCHVLDRFSSGHGAPPRNFMTRQGFETFLLEYRQGLSLTEEDVPVPF